jgi:hypothetical protein
LYKVIVDHSPIPVKHPSGDAKPAFSKEIDRLKMLMLLFKLGLTEDLFSAFFRAAKASDSEAK